MNWTRRDFIKASGIAAGGMVLDLTLPLPTMSLGESSLPEEETIHTAFIGLGDYGRCIGGLLSKNWKSDNPISLHCLRSAFESNPLIQQKGATQRIFQGYGSKVNPSFSKFWKKDPGLIHQLDRDIDPDTLQEILRGKELIFLACGEFDEAWKMARYAALEVEPFLLISLQPKLASKTHPHALLSNESILQAPSVNTFPSRWDPVTSIFGSLVNPGLIGVDIADLKSVVGQKQGHLNLSQWKNFPAIKQLEEWLKSSGINEANFIYLVVQDGWETVPDISLLHNVADAINDVAKEKSIFNTAPLEPSDAGYRVTVIYTQ